MLSKSIFAVLSVLSAVARAAPTSIPASSSNVESKRASSASRGLLYSPGPALTAFNGKIAWSVNWATVATDGNAQLGQYVSQLWGIDQNHVGNFNNAAGNYQGATLIGFNEPDNQGQSWMLPSTAVSNWGTINQYKASKGAKIGTPGVSNSALAPQTANGVVNNPQGIAWITQFLSDAKGQYTFDILTMHWYGGGGNSLAQDQAMLQSQVSAMVSLAQANNIPEVWITEMQRLNGDQECQFVEWFENTFLPANPVVTHYAYNENAGTLTSGSGLSAVGKAYIGEGTC